MVAALLSWRSTQAPTFKPQLAPASIIVEKALTNPSHYSPKILSKMAAKLGASDPLKARLNLAAEKAGLQPKVKVNTLPAEPDVTKYDIRQGSQKPEDLIASLKANGANITSIELNMPTDDVFQALVDYCPNLTTLSYNTPGMNIGNYKVTNEGLLKVSQLQNLKTFRFCVDEMFGIDEKGINALLSCPLFVNKLENLYLSLFLVEFVEDASYTIIAGYQCLQTLYLNGNILKSETLENNPLPATLTRFTFCQYPYKGLITDTFLSTLPAGLTHLNISGSWTNVSAAGLKVMQDKLTLITELALQGEEITPDQATSITKSLTALSLGDCSKLQTTDLVTITNNQPNLISYAIGNAPNFNQLVPLPSNLKSLSLDTPKLYTFNALPPTLEELTLSHINLPYNYFLSLTEMKFLRTLRIRHCRGFNDTSLIPLLDAVKDKIQFLELNGIDVTLKGAMKIAECTRLRTLILNQLYAFNADDLSTLLSNVNLRQRIVNLYIGKLELNYNNLGPILSSFTQLKDLYLMLTEFSLPKNFELNTQTVGSFWLGGSQFHKFIQLQK